MDATALLLSRLQFAFTISFHIIFPAFRSDLPLGSPFSMFWGGIVVFPLMLIYTAISYTVFRGKAGTATEHY